MLFDTKETELYYYEQIMELHISHINVSKNTIWTKEDVDNMVEDMKKLETTLNLLKNNSKNVPM